MSSDRSLQDRRCRKIGLPCEAAKELLVFYRLTKLDRRCVLSSTVNRGGRRTPAATGS